MKHIINTIDLHTCILRVHGNTRKVPTHALSVSNIRRIVEFIESYADTHAILLPGRIPGVKEYENVRLLPSSTTKKEVYKEYKRSVESLQERVCSRRAFETYWKRYVPGVRTMKSMTDLCWVCQKNSATIVRSVNWPIERQTDVS